MRSARTAAGSVLALAAILAAPVALPAGAATPVVGSYTLRYEWYSAPGALQTTPLTLNADHSCTLGAGCVWSVSGTAFTLTAANPRRGGVTYRGDVTSTGLGSPSAVGHQYFGTTGNTAQGDWYATRG